MNRKELEDKQLIALEMFYKGTDISEKKRNAMFASMGIIMLMLVLVVLLLGSNMEMMGEIWWIVLAFACFAKMGYLSRFSEFRGDDSKYSVVFLKLKYLPISGRVIFRYVFKKFLKFQSVLYVVLQIGQLLVSILSYGKIPILSIGYTFVLIWLLPMALGVLYLKLCWNVKGGKSL